MTMTFLCESCPCRFASPSINASSRTGYHDSSRLCLSASAFFSSGLRHGAGPWVRTFIVDTADLHPGRGSPAPARFAAAAGARCPYASRFRRCAAAASASDRTVRRRHSERKNRCASNSSTAVRANNGCACISRSLTSQPGKGLKRRSNDSSTAAKPQHAQPRSPIVLPGARLEAGRFGRDHAHRYRRQQSQADRDSAQLPCHRHGDRMAGRSPRWTAQTRQPAQLRAHVAARRGFRPSVARIHRPEALA